ncbi:MAG: hypothetical protein AAGF20_00070 [Pseudomonadota bacterium]
MSWLRSTIRSITGQNQADAYADGTQASADVQRYQFDESTRINAPTVAAGDSARDAQMAALGLNPSYTVAGGGAFSPEAVAATEAANDPLKQYVDYVDYYDGLSNSFATLSQDDINYHLRRGDDQDGDGQLSKGEWGYAQSHGSDAPRAQRARGGYYLVDPEPANAFDVSPSSELTGSDASYAAFEDSGHYKSMLETTESDFARIVDAMGAGGLSLSGGTVTALNDENRKNTANAFDGWYGSLAGVSGTGSQVSSQNAQNAVNLGQGLGQTEQDKAAATASSYDRMGNLAVNGIGGVVDYGAGKDWW